MSFARRRLAYRVPRLYVVGAALGLLALATPAHAECAWVLWTRVVGGPNAGWSPTFAYPDYAACQGMIAYLSPTDKAMAAQRADLRMVRQCYPDTVDPRGQGARDDTSGPPLWALWVTDGNGVYFFTVGMRETRLECEQAARGYNVAVAEMGTVDSYVCLPDTIDPRGPKK